MAGPAQSLSPYKLCPRCRLIYAAGTNFCVRDREPLVADPRIIAGRYILLHQIGRGTMSEVFAAEQPQLGRTVAIKLLHRDPEVMRRFYSGVRGQNLRPTARAARECGGKGGGRARPRWQASAYCGPGQCARLVRAVMAAMALRSAPSLRRHGQQSCRLSVPQPRIEIRALSCWSVR